MKIVFMGTPEIARTIVQAVYETGEELAAVFTQPDKKVGRKQLLVAPPVKLWAEEHGIPVYQPVRIRREKWVEILREIQPDLVVVAAFGQILSQEILDIAPLGNINIHGSILPKWRGAAPIQFSIWNGETKTGITAMMMDAGMDTGAMIEKRFVSITDEDTDVTLSEKLGAAGAELIQSLIAKLAAGEELPLTPQDNDEASYCRLLTKEDGILDFTKSARELDCQIRALRSWPSCYCNLGELRLEIDEARALPAAEETSAPGTLLCEGLSGKHPRMLVQTGEGVLEITRLTPSGKKEMRAEDFLRGYLQSHKEELVLS